MAGQVAWRREGQLRCRAALGEYRPERGCAHRRHLAHARGTGARTVHRRADPGYPSGAQRGGARRGLPHSGIRAGHGLGGSQHIRSSHHGHAQPVGDRAEGAVQGGGDPRRARRRGAALQPGQPGAAQCRGRSRAGAAGGRAGAGGGQYREYDGSQPAVRRSHAGHHGGDLRQRAGGHIGGDGSTAGDPGILGRAPALRFHTRLGGRARPDGGDGSAHCCSKC